MCFPIQYAVTYPDRVKNTLEPLDFAKLSQLDFEAPRTDDFPAINLPAVRAKLVALFRAVLNAANEARWRRL